MMRNSKYLAMALGAAVLLVGCSAQSPTAPKPTPIASFNLSLTPESSSEVGFTKVRVFARVTTKAGANAPDGTSVHFKVEDRGVFVDCADITVRVDADGTPIGATEAVQQTSGGDAKVCVTWSVGTVLLSAGVAGGTAKTSVVFTPAPIPTPPPSYTPIIDALLPNAGPFEGGTRVTISGVGFESVVQVLFDDIQAQVVSTSYTQIVCISPSITATAPPTVVTKQVKVTNLGNGKVSNGVGFRYGVTMFISSFTPMEGPADTPTTVTIFGQGFVAPVSVEIAGMSVPQWDVLSVSGTEIVSRSKPIPESARTCGDASGAITVINIGSNTKATSTQSFTYRAIRPLITSVQIDSGTNTVQQYVPIAVPPSVAVCSTPWGNHRVTIRGSGFQQGMTVNFDGLAPVPTTFVDATTLTLEKLPDLTSVSLERISCTTGAGACGNRFIPTQVGITVNNPRNGCSDTLNNAVVINPCDNSCLVTGLTTMSLGAVAPPNPQTVGTPFTIPLTFTPTPLTAAATVDLTYVGFTATPTSVTIPPSSSPYTIIVTPTSAGSGNIIASVGGGSCTVTAASGVITVNAVTFGLTVTKSGNPAGAGITSLPAGLAACAGATTPCVGTFNQGTPVTLSASTPATWTGGCTPSGTNPTASATVTMDSAKTCNAAFPGGALNVTLTLNGGATGSVTSTPAGSPALNCTTGTCSANYTTSPVLLTATPTLGSFGTWGGDCAACGTTAANCSITLAGTNSCTATFNNP